MIQADWDTWVLRHATTFGFSDTGWKMLDSWRDVFIVCRYAASDLHDATTAIATATPPRFPSEHLGAIHAAIRNTRASRYRVEESSFADRVGSCVRCSGTGRITVPYLGTAPDGQVEGVVGGEWIPLRRARGGAAYYTMAALCPCFAGKRHSERLGESRDHKPRRLLTLEEYERLNPDWKMQMREHEAALCASAAAAPVDEKIAVQWGKSVKRLVEAMATRSENERDFG